MYCHRGYPQGNAPFDRLFGISRISFLRLATVKGPLALAWNPSRTGVFIISGAEPFNLQGKL
jgi:hypothetical protein